MARGCSVSARASQAHEPTSPPGRRTAPDATDSPPSASSSPGTGSVASDAQRQGDTDSPEQRRDRGRPPPISCDRGCLSEDEARQSDASVHDGAPPPRACRGRGHSRSRGVRFATPRSINDVRVISPASHPNRMGQFGPLWPRRQSFAGHKPFAGDLGDFAQVMALRDGQVVDWLDCRITACNPDGTYNVFVLPTRSAQKIGLADQQGWSITPQELRSRSRLGCLGRPPVSRATCFAVCVLTGCALLLLSAAASTYMTSSSTRMQLRLRLRREGPNDPLGLEVDSSMHVTAVSPHGVAAAGGVEVGMRVLAIDGVRVHSAEQLTAAFRGTGQEATVTVDIPLFHARSPAVSPPSAVAAQPAPARKAPSAPASPCNVPRTAGGERRVAVDCRSSVRYEPLQSHDTSGGGGLSDAAVAAVIGAGLFGACLAGYLLRCARRRGIGWFAKEELPMCPGGQFAPCTPRLPGVPVAGLLRDRALGAADAAEPLQEQPTLVDATVPPVAGEELIRAVALLSEQVATLEGSLMAHTASVSAERSPQRVPPCGDRRGARRGPAHPGAARGALVTDRCAGP
eukprot:TRINITY_DN5312_c0_g1_i2.p1 TRINITY_DN5312_c0_g1~~TRINITY_DN5312_c0_g1_i2.p1  ORF type:complete len:571 (+),score=57.25 TRINITY_DN5312_c0_g1_i2:96-1808(+)